MSSAAAVVPMLPAPKPILRAGWPGPVGPMLTSEPRLASRDAQRQYRQAKLAALASSTPTVTPARPRKVRLALHSRQLVFHHHLSPDALCRASIAQRVDTFRRRFRPTKACRRVLV